MFADIGTPMTNITRPGKYILINTESKVTKYKPEFTFTEFKKPIVDLAFIINESDVYDEVDIAVKVTNISGIKVNNIGNPYVECVVIDKTKTKRDMKLIGVLRNSIENECVYKYCTVQLQQLLLKLLMMIYLISRLKQKKWSRKEPTKFLKELSFLLTPCH